MTTDTDRQSAAETAPAADAPVQPKRHNPVWLAICRLAGCEIDQAPAATARTTDTTTAPRTGAGTVVADNLTKTYAGGVTAAADISLRADPGEIVAVVGPNGAGKSTTLNMISGLLHPTRGTATVAGIPTTDTRRLGSVLGVALQTSGLDPAMTALEHFEVQGALYGMSKSETATCTKSLIETFGLTPYARRQIAQFSVGLQRRLVLALAMIHDPAVIVLDEPTAGLDPQSRRMVWEMLGQLQQQGRTIIFSTQLLEEADTLAQRIYVIADGRVVAQGSPAELRQTYGELSIRVRVAGPLDAAAEVLAAKLPGLAEPRRDSDSLVYLAAQESPEAAVVAGTLTDAGIDYLEVSIGRPSLEDAFVRLTGEAVQVEPLVSMGSSGGPLCRCS